MQPAPPSAAATNFWHCRVGGASGGLKHRSRQLPRPIWLQSNLAQPLALPPGRAVPSPCPQPSPFPAAHHLSRSRHDGESRSAAFAPRSGGVGTPRHSAQQRECRCPSSCITAGCLHANFCCIRHVLSIATKNKHVLAALGEALNGRDFLSRDMPGDRGYRRCINCICEPQCKLRASY